tara:strand:+ start:505 stop:693 length:189 start_codon:yes stop_codon:yes gene_type:complete
VINRSQIKKQVSVGGRMLKKRSKSKVKKVIKGLKKASKLHAKQARTLKGVIGNGKRSKSRNR